jgi:hypothetical protein
MKLQAAITTALHRAMSAGALHTFVSGPSFWPVAIKGGFENTLRDLLLNDLSVHLAEPLGNNVRCTGERMWGGSRRRGDVIVYRQDQVGDNGEIDEPLAVIELKVNFCSQLANRKPLVLQAFEKLRDQATSKVLICALQFSHMILTANECDARLLRRYQAELPPDRKQQNEEWTLDRIRHYVPAIEPAGLTAENLPAIPFRQSGGRGQGRLHAVLISGKQGR